LVQGHLPPPPPFPPAQTDVTAMVHQHRAYRESCAAGNTDHCNTESRHAAIIKAVDTHPNQCVLSSAPPAPLVL